MSIVLKSAKAGSLCIVLVAFVLAMHSVRGLPIHKEGEREAVNKEMVFSNGNRAMMTLRKLLHSADGERNLTVTGTSSSCSKQDIMIYQDQAADLPSGIHRYSVSHFIDPAVFRRLGNGDCLVNNGKPLGPGRLVFFQYANNYRYPLSVSSVVCL
ncbi:putative TPD1 protein-like protein 1-like [Sesbania bispinosa]|nr:putative TPD1 protein-like protein 1-like [Sesbania bispinosa]